MPVSGVTTGDTITEAWGDSVASSVTALEADVAALEAADTAHVAAADPHTGYRLESANHSHASSGLQGGTVAHTALTSVGANDHHTENHASRHLAAGADPLTIPAPTVQVFTADGTWTKPAGARFVRVRAIGGGGGGGGAGTTSGTQGAAGGGGGGGAYAEKLYAASDLDATEAVVVGAAGTAGATTPGTGGTGGTSTFADGADLISAAGGTGGAAGTASTASVVTGGTGGNASGADLNVGGGGGGPGVSTGNAASIGGFGGGTMLGGIQRAPTNSTDGLAGKDYGGGGSGGRNAPSQGTGRAGGAGAAGVVIVETHY